MAWGRKPFLSELVCDLRVMHILPEGSRENGLLCALVWMWRVPNDLQGLPEALLGVQLLKAECVVRDVLGHGYCRPRSLAAHAGVAAVPGGETACQKALYGAPVEIPEDLRPQAKSQQHVKSAWTVSSRLDGRFFITVLELIMSRYSLLVSSTVYYHTHNLSI